MDILEIALKIVLIVVIALFMGVFIGLWVTHEDGTTYCVNEGCDSFHALFISQGRCIRDIPSPTGLGYETENSGIIYLE